MAFDIDQLYQAMDIIIDKRLQDVNYDTTIICTVVDDTNASIGKYKVSDGTIKFDAYSDTDTYKVNDAVRVSVLKGDYSEKKFIIGKYIADDQDAMVTYVSPLETVIDMTGDITYGGSFANNVGSWGIIPNSQTTKAGNTVILPLNKPYSYVDIWSIDMTNAEFHDIQMNSIYDTLYIKADFKCLLGHLDIRTGSYGLCLNLTIGGQQKTVYFDVSEMFGNPYSFTIWSAQEKKFDIAKMGNITKAQLRLYQRNNFTQGGGKTPLDPTQFKVAPILVKNIQIGFGSEVMKVEDNTLKIYCKDDLYYNKKNDLSSNTKEMALVWYNKDDVGQYLGFSDGIEVEGEPYDEEDYIAKTTEDTRLAAQMGENVPNDKDALGLAADIEEIENLVEDSVLPLITRDIYSLIRNFENSTIGIEKFQNFCKDYADIDGIIDICEKDVRNALEENIKYYEEYLQVAAKKQKGESASVTIKTTPTNFIAILNTFYNGLFNSKDSSQLAIINEISAYQSLRDRFVTSLEDLLAKLQSYISTLGELYTTAKLAKLKELTENGYTFVEYTVLDAEQAIAQYGNRYCIYWYRARLDATDVFAGPGWERIKLTGANGLPSAQEDIAGVLRVEEKDENGVISYIEKEYSYLNKKSDQSITIALDPEKMTETIKAILIYNHEKFESEEIIFENARKDTETTINDVSATIYLEHGENSQDDYQLYGPTNYLLNSAERRLKRKLTVHYQGIKQGDEDGLVDTEVYWYIPTQATMLTYDLEDYKAEGENIPFTNDLNNVKKPEGISKEGFVCFYKKIRSTTTEEGKIVTNTNDISFTYLIKEYYSPTFSNNVIHCRIHKGDNWYEASMYFTFSSYGTSGTDYSLIVMPSGTNAAVKVEDPLPLSISLYDYNNEEIPIPIDGGSSFAISPGEPGSVKLGWVGPHCYNAPSLLTEGENIIGCEVSHKTHEKTISHYGVLSATLKFNLPDDEDETKGRMVDLTTLYPVAYSTGDYFIEGATSVIYDSNGGTPSYYLDPYRIFSRTTGEEETKDITWEIEYCDNNGNVIDLNAKDANGNLVYGIVASYLPKLKIKGKDYFLQPSTMYLSDIDYYATVLCKKGTDTIWAQPILIMQNRYASPMLNRWDGELTIDENNGTILSTMVGAGKKNTNNTFSGVLMGDITAADGGMNGLGLYGFHEGAQSFGFSVEGTAFLGKSGRGRINFDGNKGTITSSSYIDNDNGRGMLIDLDNGYINLKGDNSDVVINAKVKETDSSLKDYSDKPYFSITRNYKDGDDLKKAYLILIDDKDKDKNSYYLQSFNYATSEDNTEGMKIDLLNGHIDAYDFKLTSKGIQLNSDPNNTNTSYYMFIGQNSGPYISYSGNGRLIMKVNSLEISGIDSNGNSIEDNILDYIQDQDNATINNYDILLNQQKVFNKLTNNGTAKGIFLTNGELYINASMINTGVLLVKDYAKDKTIFQADIVTGTVQMAGWIVDENSIRAKTLGTEGSMWLCRDGTTTSTPSGFAGLSERVDGWCIAVGTNFGVHKDGTLYATGAKISGAITTNALMVTGGTITIGSSSGTYFNVDNNGKLTATKVSVSGDITCNKLIANTEGSIGGWTISSNALSNADAGTYLCGGADVEVPGSDENTTLKRQAGDIQVGQNLYIGYREYQTVSQAKGIIFAPTDSAGGMACTIKAVSDSALMGSGRHLWTTGAGYLRVDNNKGLNVQKTSWLVGPISSGSSIVSAQSIISSKFKIEDTQLKEQITGWETEHSRYVRFPFWWISSHIGRDDVESTVIARFVNLTTVHPTSLKNTKNLGLNLVDEKYRINLDYLSGGVFGESEPLFTSNLEEILPKETVLTTNLLFTDLQNPQVQDEKYFAENKYRGLGHYRYLRMAPKTPNYTIDYDGYYALSGPLLYSLMESLGLAGDGLKKGRYDAEGYLVEDDWTNN